MNFNPIKKTLDWFGVLAPLRRRRARSRIRLPIVEQARAHGIALKFTNRRISVKKPGREIRISAGHEIYLGDMIRYFDYYHGAVVPRTIRGISVVDYSLPGLQRLSRSGMEFEFPSLPESDESTETYIAALAPQSGEVVLDLGAYAGASAYFLAKAVGSEGIVVSFEPDEANFRCLVANIARHRLTNVRPIDKGVWSETTILEFQAEGNMGSAAVSVTGRTSNVKRVSVVSLEDAAKMVSGRRVAAIKMDIEGAEVEVLRNAGDFLKEHGSRLVVEPHVVEGKMATEEICGILKTFGYDTELLTQGVDNWPLIAARPATSSWQNQSKS